MALLIDKDDIFFSYRVYMCGYSFSAEIWHFLKPVITLLFGFIPICHVIAATIYLLVLARQVARRGRDTLKWQGIMTTVLVAVVYCISIMPYAIYGIGESFLDRNDESNKIFFTTYFKIVQSTLWLNTISNFYIYSLTVQSFRDFIWSKLKLPNQFLSELSTTTISGE
jgi:hypothetical protein